MNHASEEKSFNNANTHSLKGHSHDKDFAMITLKDRANTSLIFKI
jgi:hypothetical protein